MSTTVLANAPLKQQFLPIPSTTSEPKEPSALWKGFTVVVKFVYEIVAKVGLLLIFGILAHFFLPALAPSFFGAAIAITGSRLVTKILDLYDIAAVDRLKKNMSLYVDRYKLDLIAFVVSLAISALSPIAGCVIASASGTVNGFLIGVKIAGQRQEQEREASKEPKAATIQKT